jgi:hypothetical protein
MRNLSIILVVATMLLPVFRVHGQEQTGCAVLMKNISEKYVGECRKGLAHGDGEAWGIDHYTGAFKKGLPNGKGTYVWADSSVYEGLWSKGERYGTGKYTFSYRGADSIQEGQWVDDKFIGKKEDVLGYKLITQRAVERYKVYRISDGNEIRVHLRPIASGTLDVTNLQITGSSGIETEFLNSQMEFRNCEYPFKLRVTFNKWSKLKTVRVDTSLELEILRPGIWLVEIGA